MSYERPMGWTSDNPTAGHGYRNTVNNAQRLYEMYGSGGAHAAEHERDNSLTWAGQGGGSPHTREHERDMSLPAAEIGADQFPPPPTKPKRKKSGWEIFGDAMAGAAKGMGSGNFESNIPAQPAAARVDAVEAPIANIDQLNQQRQQLAAILQRLNNPWG
jgi:hypothetical protein